MRRGLSSVSLLLAALGLFPTSVSSQPVAVSVPRPPREAPEGIVGDGVSLKERLSVTRGRQLVYAPTFDERMRAVERLSSAGTPEAIEALLEAMETGSPLGRDPAGRLAVVRALAIQAGRPEVRTFLIREMLDAGARRDVTSGIFSLVRETAALALAQNGDPAALSALASAAALRGPAGDAARSAWLSSPPRTLEPMLFEDAFEPDPADDHSADDELVAKPVGGSAKPSPTKAESEAKGASAKKRSPRALSGPMLTLLGDIADLRAIGPLRAELERSDRPSRAAAALALAKMGDGTIAVTVRSWLKENDPRFVAAAAEVLVVLGDSQAPLAVKRLFELEAVRPQAMRLAYEIASPEIVDPVVKLLPSLEPADGVRAIMALGRAGAAKRVAEHLLHPALGPAAITALGSSASSDTDALIEAGMAEKQADKRRAFVRAAILRSLLTRRQSAGLSRALSTLADSKDASDVETAALGRVALGVMSAERVLEAVRGKDDALALAVVAGAARGALVRDDDARAAFAPLLLDVDPEKPTEKQVAAGVALLSEEGAAAVPFKTLLRLAEQGGALSSLAARALPSRADESLRDRLIALLEGGDPPTRVGIAEGLSRCDNPAAASWLARAYLREEDVLVRRALVTSLSARTEIQRKRVLETARDLDPDADVRAIAARGLSRQRGPRPVGLDPSLGAAFGVVAADASVRARAFRLVLPSGLAIPIVSARDGGLLVPGVPFGKATLELAAPEAP